MTGFCGCNRKIYEFCTVTMTYVRNFTTMNMTSVQQQKAAATFVANWTGKGYEKGESQIFWTTLLSQVFGIEHPETFIFFEQQVQLDHTSFVDARIPATKVMIEQKSLGKNLGEGIRQSDGSLLNPFQQAKRYADTMPNSQRPRWIVTCNFAEFWVYDLEHPNSEPQKILLANLEKEYYRLLFLVDEGNDHLKREMEVSVKAGELVGMIYDKLLEQYSLGTRMSPSASQADILRSLNILCVRLVFCLYAEDAGLFPSKTSFHDYLAPYPATKIRRALIDLFEVLDTPIAERDPYLDPDLAAFPYVNGGLFGTRTSSPAISNTQSNNADGDVRAPSDHVIIPQFTDELKQLILDKASADFDWSEISPTIFGAVFESTLNPETRRSGGMHYTSIENIHKVIDPLFLDDLRSEFAEILGARTSPSASKTADNVRAGTTALQRQLLAAFQNKLASLTFLDPACGSGNFLTETYLSLRRLENEVIQAMYGGANILTFDTLIKVHIGQFYGIEINDFACTVAKTALWIAENQMMQQTSMIAGKPMDFLPLKTNANIVEGNALRMDWASLGARSSSPASSFDYIIGNPPFVGARLMSAEQKDDLLQIFGKKWKNLGNMDYVCGWYLKAAQLMQLGAAVAKRSSPAKHIRAALVSTNSITQGEQVANLWKPLFEQYGIQFDFAYRTFRWDSEADIKAHVHCVIIGFSCSALGGIPSSTPSSASPRMVNVSTKLGRSLSSITGESDSPLSSSAASGVSAKTIYISNAQSIPASNINAYLIDAPDIWVESRSKPICDVPPLLTGSQRIDNDLFMFTDETKEEFLKKEPDAAKFFRLWYGAEEFLHNRPRWVLYLGNSSPSELKSLSYCYDIVKRVKEYRLSSKREQTLRAANYPNHFGLEVIPESNFMIVPVVSSEKRRYIPIGFMNPNVMCSNQVNLIPNATLYHFGILTSNVHMAWMRVVCGRLKSDYRYSKDIVYNNFPWPMNAGGDRQAYRVPSTAQAILDARAKYPDCSLADLYDEVTMPPELRKAHQENDRAVMAAYGFSTKMTESECVAKLFEMYQNLTQNTPKK